MTSGLNSITWIWHTVESRTKLFMATVDGRESFVVDAKISISVTLGVLDLPLSEIKSEQIK